MINTIRRPGFLKIVSVLMAILFLNEIIFPTVAMALTGGPSQPEVESFAPIEATDMVDLFSGDFKYNIPLMDVDGYPININYNSNITMDQEATWVGLGWNLNPGVINRSMRGLPDEFCGDNVTKDFSVRTSNDWGLGFRLGDLEIFGFNPLETLGFSADLNLGIKYNNYTGYGVDLTISPTTSLLNKVKGKLDECLGNNEGAIGNAYNFAKNAASKVQQATQKIDNSLNIPYMKTFTFGKGIDGINTNPISAIRYGILNKVSKTYTPQIQNDVSNYAADFNASTGISVFGIDANIGLHGYLSGQSIGEKTTSVPAYGYMYSQYNRNPDGAKVLLDYNREKDGGFSLKATNLPLTNYTYDNYSILGQGLTGSFRPYKGAVDYVFDQDSKNTGGSGSLGAEFASFNLFHAGIDINVNCVFNNSGMWSSMTNMAATGLNNPVSNSDYTFEPCYWKESGEMAIESDPTYNLQTLNDKAVQVPLLPMGLMSLALPKLKSNEGLQLSILSRIQRKNRMPRNTHISYLTAAEASVFGLEKMITTYPILKYYYANTNWHLYDNSSPVNGSTGSGLYAAIPRTLGKSGKGIGHHPSEISVTKTDGSRYVYGIPAYNLTQVEASFNVSQDGSDGLVQYTSDENSNGNTAGRECLYNKTTLPPYAHSYLLTAVLSADYVDLTGDGPTDDDLGTYTKFNYSKLPEDYKWRSPSTTTGFTALYSEGLKHTKGDNKGSFTYGEKEVWYLESIETKNQVAEFYLSDRRDGYGVSDENSACATSGGAVLQKLNKISLYSKEERFTKKDQAVPLKEVYFEYDYSLCKGIPNNSLAAETINGTDINDINNGRGKLTLKKLYFTYGNSKKGKFNPYQFSYRDDITYTSGSTTIHPYNPVYAYGSYDRWGNYMPKDILPQIGWNSGPAIHEYPYVCQDTLHNNTIYANPSDSMHPKTYADIFTTAWSLSEIKLPSGGKINVDYESDDYAYVQNERAMCMFKILGFDPVTYTEITVPTYYGEVPTDKYKKNHDSLYVQVDDKYFGSGSAEQKSEAFRKLCLQGIEDLFFNCFTKISQEGDKEYVSGYAKIDIPQSRWVSKNVCKIKLKDVDIDEADNAWNDPINPVTKAAINLCKSAAPYFAKGEKEITDFKVELSFDQLVSSLGMIGDLLNLTKNQNNKMLTSYQIGTQVDLNKSWVRLYDPSSKKLGGGSRVKRIQISDSWTFDEQSASNYGQEYDYTTQITRPDGVKVIASSGVASYEPLAGGDENPFRKPLFNKQDDRILHAEERTYIEGPIGEGFFPGSGVGYSKVTVKNLSYQNVTKHATGKVIHEFYTAKDCPVAVSQTTLDPRPSKFSFNVLSYFNLSIEDMTVSQGYSIVCNDMHGKQKSVYYYPENQTTPVSGEVYEYQLVNGQVNNKVNYFNPNGSVVSGEMGVDQDVVYDFRSQASYGITAGAKINLATFMVGFIPILIPTVYPSFGFSTTSFHSAVVTKVINRKAILNKVTKYDLSSQVSAENLIYDKETGEVLLTKTVNEFDDPIYSFTYPAHWAYDQMGPAYKNDKAYVSCSGNVGTLVVPAPRKYFTTGDEVCLLPSNTKAWIFDVTDNQISLIDIKGNPISSSLVVKGIKVMRSGRRNQQSTPIGSVTTLKNPVSSGSLFIDSTKYILNATATEYDNVRKARCNYSGIDCERTLSPEMEDMISLLQHLIVNHKFNGSAINLNTPEYYPNLYTPVLKEAFKASNATYNNYLKAVQNSNNYEIRIDNVPNGSFSTLYMTLHNFYPGSTIGISGVNLDYNYNLKDIKCEPTGTLGLVVDNYGTTGNTSTINHSVIDATIDLYGHYAVLTSSVPNNYITNSLVNPYAMGLLGHWYPKKSYEYLTTRHQTLSASTNPDTRQDGYFDNYSNFWVYNTTSQNWKKNTNAPKWELKSEITKVDPDGVEIEDKDALDIYSSSLFGYNGKLPTAIAQNAKHREIVYHGFEDYNLLAGSQIKHDSITVNGAEINYPTSYIDTIAHTGKYSLKLPSSGYMDIVGTIKREFETVKTHDQIVNIEDDSLKTTYHLDTCDCMKPFSPVVDAGKDTAYYLLSFWYKDSQYYPENPSSAVSLSIQGNSGASYTSIVTAKSPIEGWVKVDARIKIPASGINTDLKIRVQSSSNGSINIDDIRIHPDKASMKSYVYNPISYKYMAELDENNYATFYEYDEEGALARVKKETEKGVFTVKEVRKSFPKQ